MALDEFDVSVSALEALGSIRNGTGAPTPLAVGVMAESSRGSQVKFNVDPDQAPKIGDKLRVTVEKAATRTIKVRYADEALAAALRQLESYRFYLQTDDPVTAQLSPETVNVAIAALAAIINQAADG